MDDGMDYEVQTDVIFQLDFDGSGECNMLLLPDVQEQFARHVQQVYEQDDTLSEYISRDLDFCFNGRNVLLQYVFSCHDENTAEAESFSAHCVRRVKKQLEEFGCKVKGIHCKAARADRTWLERLWEDPPALPKKGKKRSGQER